MKARMDAEAAYHMSAVARQGFTNRGRGAVNLRFRSVHLAHVYLRGGWPALADYPGTYLYYYTVNDLLDNQKDAAMIELCRRYDPTAKLILFVSIIADVEECPTTPVPTSRAGEQHARIPLYDRNKMATPQQIAQLEARIGRSPQQQQSDSVDTSSATLKSMLRNMQVTADNTRAPPPGGRGYQSSTPLIV
jgi:hypothetical protein